MNPLRRNLWIATLRGHATELVAVLLVGFVVGVAIGVFADAGGNAKTPAVAVAPAHLRKSPSEPLPAASAGVQPGRAEAESDTELRNQAAQGEALAAEPVLKPDARASFEAFVERLPSHVELTVAPLGEGTPETLGGDEPAHGWSTTKVPVLAALLRARGTAGLSAEEQTLAHEAITESSNEAIVALFKVLEGLEGGLQGASEYVQRLFRDSGDEETVVTSAPPPPGAATTFGQTEWRPSNAVKFFSALARYCLPVSHEATDYILELMENIEPGQSWGLGDAGFAHVAFKDGWGPEPDGGYIVRQSGIVGVGTPRAVAVAIVAFPQNFAEGQEMLTETARWLHKHIRLVPRSPVPCSD